MGNEDDIFITLGIGGAVVGVAILVTKIGKELAIAASNASHLALKNAYQLAYSYIPANETDILPIVDAIYLSSLSNLQYTTDSIIQTYTMMEYLLYFIGSMIGLMAIIKLIKRFIS